MKLSRNIASGWTYIAINTAIVLFMTPFIIRSLGMADFGVWALLFTVLGYLKLLDFGSQQAQARFLSRALGKNDSNHFRDIFSNTAILFFVIGLLILIAVWVMGQFGAKIFNIPADEQETFRAILWVMGAVVAVEFMTKSYGGSLAARERLDVINLIEIVGAIVQAVFVFSVLKLNLGLVGMTIGVALTMLMKILAYVVIGRASYPAARISLRRYNPKIMRELLGYGSVSYLIIATDLIKTNIGIPVIAAFLTTTDAAFYSIAAQFVFYFYLMGRSVSSAFIPRISRLEGQGNWAELREQFLLGTRIMGMATIFVGSSMMIFGGKFIELWLGVGFDVSYYVLLLLAPAAMLSLLQSLSTSFLFATSNHGFYAKINVAESVLAVILGLLLVKPLGLYGMALGALIPAVIFRVFVQPVVTCRLVGISVTEYFRRGVRDQLLFGVVYALLAWVSLEFLYDHIQSLWMFLAVASGFLVVGGALAYTICLTNDERIMILVQSRKWFLRGQQSTL